MRCACSWRRCSPATRSTGWSGQSARRWSPWRWLAGGTIEEADRLVDLFAADVKNGLRYNWHRRGEALSMSAAMGSSGEKPQ
jgi:hypothetical protein